MEPYVPARWEKITSYAMAIWIVALVSYLLIRNQRFEDPNLAVGMRILLSLSTAILGAVIPGFLHVDMQGKGLAIRAGGALVACY